MKCCKGGVGGDWKGGYKDKAWDRNLLEVKEQGKSGVLGQGQGVKTGLGLGLGVVTAPVSGPSAKLG